MVLNRLLKTMLTAFCLLALSDLFDGPSLAGIANGAVPPGTIYFSLSNSPYDMSMKGDGSGKKAANKGATSYQRHAGSSIHFIVSDYDYNGTPDPNGNPPVELFAVNESYQVFQLTSDPNIQWTYQTLPVWGKNDSFFSFTGVQNTETGVDGGLFIVAIDWTSGVPIPGMPNCGAPAQTDWFGWWSNASVNLWEHDWSPAGDQVVKTDYDAAGAAQLHVASFSSAGVTTRLLTAGSNPVWSPSGDRIAFNRSEIWTIRPDGTSAVKLTLATTTSRLTQKQTTADLVTRRRLSLHLPIRQRLRPGRPTPCSASRLPAGWRRT